MNSALRKTFNTEVEKYRRTLLCSAEENEWNLFKVNAGGLFDYLEAFEMLEVEKKFFKIFKCILVVIVLSSLILFRVNPEWNPDIKSIKDFMVLMAVAGCCFELYFFMNFRAYLEYKTTFYRKRREKFIRDIERDFKKR